MEPKVTKTINIDGLHCGACQKIIERKISKINGVVQVDALLSGAVTITANRPIGDDEVKLALEGTDYRVSTSS